MLSKLSSNISSRIASITKEKDIKYTAAYVGICTKLATLKQYQPQTIKGARSTVHMNDQLIKVTLYFKVITSEQCRTIRLNTPMLTMNRPISLIHPPVSAKNITRTRSHFPNNIKILNTRKSLIDYIIPKSLNVITPPV